ncbi:MAG: PAS domain-containing protein, partial [Anaerolineae bacterium]|nr:PAS domain-containing protein [Anaerolineae bacterium]
ETTLEQLIINRTNRMQLLQDIAVATNEHRTVEAVMQLTLERLCNYTGWPAGHVYLADLHASSRLISTSIWHIDDVEYFAPLKDSLQNNGEPVFYKELLNQVVATGQPAWTTDFESHQNHNKVVSAVGLKLISVFPVWIEKQVVALLEFFSDRDSKPDESLLEIMVFIGTQLGYTIERKWAEARIKQREIQLAEAQKIARLGSWEWYIEANRVVWSDELYRIYGLDPKEGELTYQIYLDLLHPDDRNQVKQNVETAFRTHQPFEHEHRIIRPDGIIRIIQGRGKVILDKSGNPSRMFGTSQDVTERREAEAELTELRQKLLEDRETERLHRAQELHDGPLQDLHSAMLRLSELEPMLSDETSLTTMVVVQATLQQAIQSLRGMCGELRPPALAPFGLEKAIRSHAEQFQKMHPDLTVLLDLMPDAQQLPERTRLALFRIYQQSLSNVIRHAQAETVTVRLKLDDDHVKLEIEDDGQGFHMPNRPIKLARKGHLGLVGAIERTEALNGTLDVVSAPGQGSLIRAVVPRDEKRKN